MWVLIYDKKNHIAWSSTYKSAMGLVKKYIQYIGRELSYAHHYTTNAPNASVIMDTTNSAKFQKCC